MVWTRAGSLLQTVARMTEAAQHRLSRYYAIDSRRPIDSSPGMQSARAWPSRARQALDGGQTHAKRLQTMRAVSATYLASHERRLSPADGCTLFP